jgi:hypothetical protein
MRGLLVFLCFAYAAGSLGALANSVAVWASGEYGVSASLEVAIAPALTAAWLYPRLVWGGIWGLLFLLPYPRTSWWVRGIIYSLGPTAMQLFWVFPEKTPHGMAGLELGMLTPLLVVVFNIIWGLVAAATLRIVGRA